MATYELTSPQGEKYQVNAPDNASQDQVMQYFQQNSGHPDFKAAQTPQPPSMLDAFTKGAYSPFKPIVDNTLEALGSAVNQTGQAMSEPMNNPNANGAMAVPDAIMRGVGKVGNAMAGTMGAVMSPLVGSLSASAEPVLPTVAKGISAVAGGDASKITPEQYHGVAMQTGGDLANAVMLGKAGQQGEANLRQQQGLPAIQPPSDPLQPVYDKMKAMTADNSPRAGFLKSNSSDPMQTPAAPTYTPDEMITGAKAFYANGEKVGGSVPVQTIQQTIQGFLNNKDIAQQTTRGKLFAGDSPVTQTLADLQAASKDNTPWTVADANEIDDAIRGRIQVANRAGDYASARSLGLIKSGLKDVYQTAAQNDPQGAAGFGEWIKGDKLYSAGQAAQDIQDIIENGRKADVPSTAIKNGFKTFVKNDNNRIGLTDEEWAAANNAATTGIVTGALKSIGSRLGAHIMGTGAGLAGGGLMGAPIGNAAGLAVTAPFRYAANAIQAGKGQSVIDMISQRPAVQAAMNPPQAAPAAAAPPLPLKSIMQLPPSQAMALLQSMLIPKQSPAGK